MDSLPVTLIVKAPNQQIEDQKIRCESTWTINKLKQHLSEVYPSKPPQHEQKLIYSGQLLNDSLVLKDVLRQYEGQDTHTVHLVCTPKMDNTERRTARESRSSTQSASATPNPQTSGNVSPEQVVRNRTGSETGNGTSFPNNAFGNWTGPNGQMPTTFDPRNLSHYQQYQQMAWMHQAYMQYMTQYMQLTGQTPPIGTLGPLPTATPPTMAGNPPDAPQAAAQPNPAIQNQQENDERDWLDLFYMLSRAIVLFSFVYFYSSPIRFMFVLFLGLTLYLYQSGFFRNININNNNINVTPNEGGPQEEQAPTRLTVAWTFITTFFASLVPEIPNINA